jgi:hypothetical protein
MCLDLIGNDSTFINNLTDVGSPPLSTQNKQPPKISARTKINSPKDNSSSLKIEEFKTYRGDDDEEFEEDDDDYDEEDDDDEGEEEEDLDNSAHRYLKGKSDDDDDDDDNSDILGNLQLATEGDEEEPQKVNMSNKKSTVSRLQNVKISQSDDIEEEIDTDTMS